jgi:nitrite reductase/ring-hydroxylating ferredoxin subunit
MAGFVKVAKVSEIPQGQGKAVEVGGKRVALFNVDGSIHAIDDACTHLGGPLSDGTLDGKNVTCPWHGAMFDIASGNALTPPAPGSVQCYKVRVEAGEIEVEV